MSEQEGVDGLSRRRLLRLDRLAETARNASAAVVEVTAEPSAAQSTTNTTAESHLVPEYSRRQALKIAIPAAISLAFLGRKTVEAAGPSDFDRDAAANFFNHQARELGKSIYHKFCKDHGVDDEKPLSRMEQLYDERAVIHQSSELLLHPDRDYMSRLTADQILSQGDGELCNKQLLTLWFDGQISSTQKAAGTSDDCPVPPLAQLEQVRQLLLSQLRVMTFSGQSALQHTIVRLAEESKAFQTPGLLSPDDYATGILSLLLLVDERDPTLLPSIGITLTHSAQARVGVTDDQTTWRVTKIGEDAEGRYIYEDEQMELANQRQAALHFEGQAGTTLEQLEAEYKQIGVKIEDLAKLFGLGVFGRRKDPPITSWSSYAPRPVPRNAYGERVDDFWMPTPAPARSTPSSREESRNGRRRVLKIIGGGALSFTILGGLTAWKPQFLVFNTIGKGWKKEADLRFPDLTRQLFSFSTRRTRDPTSKFVAGSTTFERGSYLHTPLEKIPALTKLSLVALEDDRFFSHDGWNTKGLLRGFFIGSGTSTLTMQLVEWLMHEQLGSIEAYDEYVAQLGSRHVKGAEILLASSLEITMKQVVAEQHPDWNKKQIKLEAKEQILEWYLNTVAMGTNEAARGIQGALLTYTTVKELSQLNEKEQVAFGLLPNRPGLFSSAISETQREKFVQIALSRMVETNQLTEADAVRIASLPWEHLVDTVSTNPYFAERSSATLGVAADYVALAASQETQVIANGSKHSRSITLDEHLRDHAGQVELHMHPQLQAGVHQLRVDHEAEHLVSEDQFRMVSIIVRGARTGRVYSFVGNTLDLQPGSTSKLAQYHAYFASKNADGKPMYDRHSLLTDDALDIVLRHSVFDDKQQLKQMLEEWIVTNDGGGQFGTTELRKIFAQSGNRAIVWQMMRWMGIGIREEFSRFGLIDEQPDTPRSQSAIHAASCLGAFNTSILRLVRMAATITNEGRDVGNAFIGKITDAQGERWSSAPQTQQVADRYACREIVGILSDPDNVTPDPWWDPFTDQSLKHWFKTGTNDAKPNEKTGGLNQDGICVGGTTDRVKRGFDEELAVAVVVHDQGGNGAAGLIDAAPIALEALKLADRLVRY